MDRTHGRIRRLVGGLALATLLLIGSYGTAAAAPIDDAAGGTTADGTFLAPVDATPTAPAMAPAATWPNVNCVGIITTNTRTCYQWEGDDQWVVDDNANGWKSVVHVQTSYGKDRYCGAPPKADGWGVCNYDHRENTCVHFRTYELKDGATRYLTPFGPWYNTASGNDC